MSLFLFIFKYLRICVEVNLAGMFKLSIIVALGVLVKAFYLLLYSIALKTHIIFTTSAIALFIG